MRFEWGESKHAANIAKHGIGFDTASRIFEGPVLEKIDRRRNYGEERIAALGIVSGIEFVRRLYLARKCSAHHFRAES